MRQSIAVVALFATLCATAAGAARAGGLGENAPQAGTHVAMRAADAPDAQPCARRARASLDIYFPRDEGALTAQAHAALSAFAAQLDGCQVTRLTATVLADDAATPARRESLFEARRIAVLRALAAEGVAPGQVTVDAVIRRTEGVPTDAVLPMGRRVELELALDAPTVG